MKEAVFVEIIGPSTCGYDGLLGTTIDVTRLEKYSKTSSRVRYVHIIHPKTGDMYKYGEHNVKFYTLKEVLANGTR